jgi:YD repeat-containing protein
MIRALVLGLAALAATAPAFAQTSPSPFTYGTRYDAMRRVTGTIAPDPDDAGPLGFAAVRNTYDAAGRLVKVEKGELSGWQSEAIAPASWTGFTVLQTVDTVYDALDRKVKETRSGGGSVQTFSQFKYDIVGRLQCTAIRMDPAQWAGQTDACIPQTSGPTGPDRVVKNIYDNAGQLVQVREGVGSTVEAAEATYGYTPNGKRQTVIDGEGNRAKLTYDGHDRLAQWQFPSITKAAAYDDSTPATALATAGSVNAADMSNMAMTPTATALRCGSATVRRSPMPMTISIA